MNSLRILMNYDTWLGGGGYTCLRALRSVGHSVQNVPEAEYLIAWRSTKLRVLRLLLMPRIIGEINRLRRRRNHL